MSRAKLDPSATSYKGGQSFNRYKVTTKRSVILVTSSPWRERKQAILNGEITMEQSTNWESLIAQRMRPCVALKIEDPVKRNIRNKERIKDRTPDFLILQDRFAVKIEKDEPYVGDYGLTVSDNEDECEFTVAINFCPMCGRKLTEEA